MRDTLLGVLIFGGFLIGIWLSYRLFMRGDTNEERVASRLPKDFKADWSWRCGDTYVGYEPSSGRLAIVDYPHGTVVNARDVVAIEPSDEGALGIVHRWLVVSVRGTSTRFRLWFKLSSARRDSTLARLKEIAGLR
jgi:hypothetical protein